MPQCKLPALFSALYRSLAYAILCCKGAERDTLRSTCAYGARLTKVHLIEQRKPVVFDLAA